MYSIYHLLGNRKINERIVKIISWTLKKRQRINHSAPTYLTEFSWCITWVVAVFYAAIEFSFMDFLHNPSSSSDITFVCLFMWVSSQFFIHGPTIVVSREKDSFYNIKIVAGLYLNIFLNFEITTVYLLLSLLLDCLMWRKCNDLHHQVYVNIPVFCFYIAVFTSHWRIICPRGKGR